MKFDWVLLKVIHLDVNSDVNSQPFSMEFCRQHRLLLRQLPCKFGEVWLITAKVINEIFCEIWLSIIESYSFRRQFRRQFLTVFHVVLQAPSAGITATSLQIWRSLINVNFAKFDLLLQKLLKKLVWNLIEYY